MFFVPLETLQGTYNTPFTLESAALFALLGLPFSLYIRHGNGALFLRLGLTFTLIRHENGALFLRLGLSFTLIRHENGALFLRLGLSFTLIRNENGAFENALQIGEFKKTPALDRN